MNRRPRPWPLLFWFAVQSAWASPSDRSLSRTVAAVAAQTRPSTVHIHADRGRTTSLGLEQLQAVYGLPPLQPPSPNPSTSTGSGVLIHPDGLILTNHHVIRAAQTLTVTLWDQRTLPAMVLGTDPQTDMTVLQILADGPFPVADIGNSDTLTVGEWVVTIGHPFEFPFTVTTGIISALHRGNIIEDEIQDYIQTDAAVNPGSSGGPLLNLDGEMVGLNTAIFTPKGGQAQHAGIAFAIPVNMAMRIAGELQTQGWAVRGGMGVQAQDVHPSLTQPYAGAEITAVLATSPADAAGLQPGDVILRIDDQPVTGKSDLRRMLQSRGAGERITVDFLREEHRHTVRLTTAAGHALTPPPPPQDGEGQWAGMRLLATGVDTPEPQDGLLVLAVQPDSPAAMAGLMAGDVLLRVLDTPTTDVSVLHTRLQGQSATIVHAWRGSGTIHAVVAGLTPP